MSTKQLTTRPDKHPTIREYIFFSSIHGTVTNNHILGHEESFNKFQSIYVQ